LTYVVNDEWGPAVSYVLNQNTSTPETVVTWYDTRFDQNNNQAAIWAMSSTNYGVTWTAPFQVSPAWDETEGVWWDYQALASEPHSYTFLAAWGGDAHLGPGLDGIWSSVLQ
jgi:hypothetical protein